MSDKQKTKDQLIKELAGLRRQLKKLEKSGTGKKPGKTEHKKENKALIESENRFRELMENAPMAIIIINKNGEIEYINKTNFEMCGYTIEDVPTLERWWSCVYRDEETRKKIIGEWSVIADKILSDKKEIIKAERKIYCKDGTAKDFELIISQVGGKFFVLFHDILERKKAEEELKKAKKEIELWNKYLVKKVEEKTAELKQSREQLFQSEKLSSLGQLAAGIAHELSSPLTGMASLVKVYRQKTAKDSKEYHHMTSMMDACEYMSKIVKDFSAFSRKSTAELTEIDIRDIIEYALHLAAGRLKLKNIEVIKEYTLTLPKVKAKKTELQQVALNITLNAIDAMDDNGTLVIRTGIEQDGSRIMMSFIDNGCGIIKENIGKIFDPFFTTKEPGKGIGIGLSVSNAIIQNLGGSITVESEPHEGSRFTVLLPVKGGENEKS